MEQEQLLIEYLKVLLSDDAQPSDRVFRVCETIEKQLGVEPQKEHIIEYNEVGEPTKRYI